MLLIYGKRLYGKVAPFRDEEGNELLHVATFFYHLYFIPLIPAKSFVVISGSQDGDGFKGSEISLNGRSVLAAYARAFTLFYVMMTAVMIAMVATEGPQALKSIEFGGWVFLLCGLAILIGALYSYRAVPGYTEQLAVDCGLLQRFQQTERGLVTADPVGAGEEVYVGGATGKESAGGLLNVDPLQFAVASLHVLQEKYPEMTWEHQQDFEFTVRTTPSSPSKAVDFEQLYYMCRNPEVSPEAAIKSFVDRI